NVDNYEGRERHAIQIVMVDVTSTMISPCWVDIEIGVDSVLCVRVTSMKLTTREGNSKYFDWRECDLNLADTRNQ
ncbi:hypothetical protein PFISCL1PPCAC_28011, partial [Pristionchus fissidentatus]